MNRRNFLTKLILGAAAIAVAPKILIPKETDLMTKITQIDPTSTPLDQLLAMQKQMMRLPE